MKTSNRYEKVKILSSSCRLLHRVKSCGEEKKNGKELDI